MSCLKTAKVPCVFVLLFFCFVLFCFWFCLFPATFLNLNFLTTSVLSFIKKKSKKIASICTELDSQPVVDTYISHSFVGSELCSFEPVSQEFVRKLICDYAPNSCVLDPIPTTLLKKEFR